MLGTQYRADLVISDQAGQTVAVVELKNRRDLRRDIAVQLRRNLAAHAALGSAPYFLLLSQDTGYLWKGARPDEFMALPSEEFPMRAVVARYSSRVNSSDRLRESEFAALVFRWLQSLTRIDNRASNEAESALQRAGLLDAMRGGSVTDQVVV